MSAEDDDDHEATLARKCAKAFRMLAEMSHKGGADGREWSWKVALGAQWSTRQYSSFPFCATGSRKRHSQVSALDLPRDRAG